MASYALNSSIERTLLLTNAGLPVSGILYNEVVVQIKKPGEGSFSTLTLIPSQWVEMGNGFYTVTLPPSVTDVAGTLAYNITGDDFDNLVFDNLVIIDPLLINGQQSYFQDQASERTVFLTLAGVPAGGVMPAQVICKIKKAGQNSFTPKVLDLANWINLGGGYYNIKFSAADMSKVGTFVYTLESTEFDNFIYDEFSILPAQDTTVKDKCIVKGQFISLSGNRAQNTKVTAKSVEYPARSGNRIVSGDIVWTILDSEGRFELALLRGATVILEVPRAGIRHQIEIPDVATAELTDLLPPFAVNYSI